MTIRGTENTYKKTKITLKRLINEVEIAMLDRPPHIREGQFVFNYIEKEYGQVARDVMEYDGVDCFYIDRNIEKFLACVHKRLNSNGD